MAKPQALLNGENMAREVSVDINDAPIVGGVFPLPPEYNPRSGDILLGTAEIREGSGRRSKIEDRVLLEVSYRDGLLNLGLREIGTPSLETPPSYSYNAKPIEVMRGAFSIWRLSLVVPKEVLNVH